MVTGGSLSRVRCARKCFCAISTSFTNRFKKCNLINPFQVLGKILVYTYVFVASCILQRDSLKTIDTPFCQLLKDPMVC